MSLGQAVLNQALQEQEESDVEEPKSYSDSESVTHEPKESNQNTVPALNLSKVVQTSYSPKLRYPTNLHTPQKVHLSITTPINCVTPNSAVYTFVENPETPRRSISSHSLIDLTTPSRYYTPAGRYTPLAKHSSPLLKSALKKATLQTPRSTLLSSARLALHTADVKSPLGKNTSSPLVKRLSTNTKNTRFSLGEKLTPIKKLNLNSPLTKRIQNSPLRTSISGITSLNKGQPQIGSAKKICNTSAAFTLDTSKTTECK